MVHFSPRGTAPPFPRHAAADDLPRRGEHDRTRSPGRHQWDERLTMPSLLRFLAVIAVLCGLVYGALYSLAHFVQPKPREITVAIPPDRFFKNR
jgi:hypothetical protein